MIEADGDADFLVGTKAIDGPYNNDTVIQVDIRDLSTGEAHHVS